MTTQQQSGGGVMAAGFNEDDPRYKCCCQSCHSKQGTMIVAIIGAVCAVINLLGDLATGNWGGILSIIIQGIMLGCLFYGLKTERAGFLVPYLVVSAISVVVCILAGIGLILVLLIGGTTVIARILESVQKQQGHNAEIDADTAAGAVPSVNVGGGQPGVALSEVSAQGYGYPPAYRVYPPQQLEAPHAYPENK